MNVARQPIRVPKRAPSRPTSPIRLSDRPRQHRRKSEDIDAQIKAVWKACYEGRLSWIEAARRDEALRQQRDGGLR